MNDYAYVRERMRNEIIDNLAYAHLEGMDKPEVVNWKIGNGLINLVISYWSLVFQRKTNDQ